MANSYTLAQLAQSLDAQVQGDPQVEVTAIAPLEKAGEGQISFLSSSKYRKHLEGCHASVVILSEADAPFWSGNALIMKNPYLGYARLAQLLDTTPVPAVAIASSAVIGEDVTLGHGVAIGANAVIESGVELADGVIVGPGCFIGKQSRIGARSRLWANVTVYHGVSIGEDCLLQAGAVIGGDGFGYANDGGRWIKIPQLGGVRIGNRVEIGACTTIDRGALEDTVIADGVIIDNQCQIAHNVEIGENTAVAGATVMAGSLKVGKQCVIGGASVFNGHMEITDNVHISGMAMVMRPIDEPGYYSSGIPLQSNREWRKTAARVLKIEEMHKRLKAVEKQLADKK